ncbi:DUF4003 family protein [Oceanirhabdus seepicola]|uniref:DUF4003 domain-containing protein n=1 Tax=Oceanirhabdus seepicola TaxID=2828781 RepID=A0A9J6P0J6_9CLOT|nr:DUF4003 family protein [Oceanirhabdus seepicola]MCM1988968.1 DUF4003 domain-containing protein [Oceanirhabdus seepicola]
MKSELKSKVDNMLDVFIKISKDYKWENNLSQHFAALTYILKNKEFEKEKIDDMKKVIKENTGVFSSYRGNTMFILSMLLCSEYDNPNEKFIKMMDYDKKLKAEGFKNNTYLPIANYALLLTCEEDLIDSRIKKAYEIYCEMKKNHPWLTSGDDYPLCVLLANSDKPIDTNIKNIEDCYKLLNEEGFSKGNGLQFLSHILSIGDEYNSEKVQRCKKIFDSLKENKLRIYSSYYAALGLITLISKDNNEVIQDLIDVAEYLNGLKKYKWLGKGMNVLIASAIVSTEYIEDKTNQKDLIATTLGITVEALIAAQTAAMVATAAASTAAVSSATT